MDHHHHHMPVATTTQAMSHDHNSMDHSAMDHSSMDHSSMDHSFMNHSLMNHSSMDHSSMDHSSMDHSSMDHSMMDHGDMPGMKMYFHLGDNEYVLFEDCLTNSVGAIIGACFVMFFLAVLYEGLKFLREVLHQRKLSSNRMAIYNVDRTTPGSSQEAIDVKTKSPPVTSQIFSCDHFIQTCLHMVQVFVSYCLMLVFMTYNVWLCLAIILGAGVGYFIFGWKRAVVVDTNEHCH